MGMLARPGILIEKREEERETRGPLHCQKLALIGVGLLGGSLGLAARQRRLARTVVGLVRRKESLAECRKTGAVDIATMDAAEAANDADLVVFCTPVGQMQAIGRQVVRALRPGAIVTDVGSVKGSVVRELEPLVRRAGGHFVGSHPMAGAEKSGVAAARADLFEGAVCVVTPSPGSNQGAVRAVERFWRGVGCQPIRLRPAQHDALVSRSSHLPHLTAALLANLVLDPGLPPEQPLLCANGFRDCTRVASGSPEMWRDIVVANGREIDRALGRFRRQFDRLHALVRKGDGRRLRSFLARAKGRRDRWLDHAVTRSPE